MKESKQAAGEISPAQPTTCVCALPPTTQRAISKFLPTNVSPLAKRKMWLWATRPDILWDVSADGVPLPDAGHLLDL